MNVGLRRTEVGALRSCSAEISRAMTRAPMSLKASVGP